MSPAATDPTASAERTLLLSPPSLSSHPDALNNALSGHDRQSTDIQMLDRLAVGLASLPPSTYDLILLLSDAHGHPTEAQNLLTREIMSKIYDSMKPGAKLQSQDGAFGSTPGPEKTEAILAGLVLNDGPGAGMMKPASGPGSGLVMLKLGSKKNHDSVPLNSKRKSDALQPDPLSGVGFVDFTDDLDIPIITGEDDELIDEDDLLTEEDKIQGIIQRNHLSLVVDRSVANLP